MLVTNEILEKYNSAFVIDLITSLVGSLEKDLLEIKLNINTQCRITATHFMEQMAKSPDE
jgi:actin related protein 2/3 complex, subunit 4